jgi:NADH:ubiquinone oxidoreductase subunit F (NADH-binding)
MTAVGTLAADLQTAAAAYGARRAWDDDDPRPTRDDSRAVADDLGAEPIRVIGRSGLRGHGGADFPTATKLQSVATRRGGATVVVNGSETERGAPRTGCCWRGCHT